jgi:hypothetical protein
VHTNILRIGLQIEVVTEEVLPDGPIRFPDGFVKAGAKRNSKIKMQKKPLPTEWIPDQGRNDILRQAGRGKTI